MKRKLVKRMRTLIQTVEAYCVCGCPICSCSGSCYCYCNNPNESSIIYSMPYSNNSQFGSSVNKANIDYGSRTAGA